MSIRSQIPILLFSAFACLPSQAQVASSLNVRSLAATCANCHGTDGRTTLGSAIPALAGMPHDYMLTQFKAFKDGSRPATVMHQISKGITEQQIELIASYFASLQR